MRVDDVWPELVNCCFQVLAPEEGNGALGPEGVWPGAHAQQVHALILVAIAFASLAGRNHSHTVAPAHQSPRDLLYDERDSAHGGGVAVAQHQDLHSVTPP